MALLIEEVILTPNPIPSGGGLVRATCRLASDQPVTSVVAYPPEGDAISFRRESDSVFVAEEYVPPGVPPGTYDVVFVARDAAGGSARKTVPVTLEG